MPRNDPRLSDLLKRPINDRIADRSIRHALFLERLKTGEATAVLKFLDKKVLTDLQRLAKDHIKRYGVEHFTKSRLAKLMRAADGVLKGGYRAVKSEFTKSLQDIAISEAEWQLAVFGDTIPKAFGIDLITPSPQLLKTLVKTKPFGASVKWKDGKTLDEWFTGLERRTKVGMNRAIKLGMAQGETIPQIVQRLRGTRAMGYKDGVFGVVRREATALARTAVARVSNAARMETFQANSDVIKGWQFVATLDARTTDICMAHDGKFYKLGEGGADQPPLHMQCRSTMTPITKSFEELGLKGFKNPATGRTKKFKSYAKGERASLDGGVPASVTYPEWLKRQPLAVQEEALGKGKAALFRRGKLPIEKFIDRKNKPLTLAQLIDLEKRL